MGRWQCKAQRGRVIRSSGAMGSFRREHAVVVVHPVSWSVERVGRGRQMEAGEGVMDSLIALSDQLP